MLATSRGGSGAPLVLIHGIGSGKSVWDPMRPHLEKRFDVIAFDLPGFGEQPWFERDVPPTMASLATAAVEEIERLEIADPLVAGNSMGGWISLELGRLGVARDVVAIAPVGGSTPSEQRKTRRVLQGTRLAARTFEPIAGVIAGARPLRWAGMRSAVSHPARVRSQDAVAAIRNMAHSTGFPLLLDDVTGPSGEAEASRSRFAGSDFPALILFGTKDRVLAPQGAPRLAAALPGAELRWLPELGHAPMLDHPEQTAELVVARATAS